MIVHAKVLTALGDPTRLQMVELLAQREVMSGTELAEYLGISLSLSCHHVKILLEAQLVEKHREGQTKFYALNRPLLSATLEQLNQLIQPQVAERTPD